MNGIVKAFFASTGKKSLLLFPTYFANFIEKEIGWVIHNWGKILIDTYKEELRERVCLDCWASVHECMFNKGTINTAEEIK
jgi:hypothetical protein